MSHKIFRLLCLLRRWLQGSTTEWRLYVGGAIILGVWFFVVPFLPLSVRISHWSLAATLFGCYGMFAAGLTLEIVRFFTRHSAQVIGKFLLGILAAVVLTIATASARHCVNEITGVNPASYPFATSVLAVVFSPLVWGVAVFVLIGVFVTAMMLFLFAAFIFDRLHLRTLWFALRNSWAYRFLLNRPRVKVLPLNLAPLFFHLLGSFGLLVFLGKSFQLLTAHQAQLDSVLSTLVVLLEYFPKSDCANVTPGELVAFVGDSKISVASTGADGQFIFEVRTCLAR